MTHKPSLEVAGAVQARLVYLRRRKALLDELIRCLEKHPPQPLQIEAPKPPDECARAAGTAP